MFLELYYEHYGAKDYYEKWIGEEKVLPYLVRFTSYEEMKDFKDFLRSEGFRQVDLSSNFIGIYINVLLAAIKDMTGGESFKTNVQLALNNVRCACRIATELSK